MRALLIGINKYKTQRWLNGCVNDVINVRDTLIANAGLKTEDIQILQDEAATTDKIRESLEKLAKGAVGGQRLWIHFSGHGDQLRTNSAEEPDGLDEVLCPYDFDFEPSNAIRDDDLIQFLRTIPATSDVIITLDCCHSGDYSRDTRMVRTPDKEPTDVATARRSGVARYNSLNALGLSPNCLVISACQPTQLAYETTDRQAGAFTKAFFAQVNASPRESMRQIVEIATTALSSLPQTPVMEGSDLLRDESYAPASRSLSRNALRPSPRGGQILWSQEFGFNAAGSGGTVGVRVTLIDGNFWLETFVNMFGLRPTMSVPLGGDVNETFAIAFGFSLTVGVSNFSLGHEQLSFKLRLSVKTPIPFIPPVTVLDAPITIPLSGLTRSIAPIGSLADLAAFQALQAQSLAVIAPNKASVQLPARRQSARGGRTRGAPRVEINFFMCLKAEAIFGDRIEIFCGGQPVYDKVVNSAQTDQIRQQKFFDGEESIVIEAYQSYTGQDKERIIYLAVAPTDTKQNHSHTVNAGDDGDPGGSYVLNYTLLP